MDWSFILGQVDFLLIAAMLICAYMMEKDNALAAALCFTMAFTKPQICFLAAPSVFIALILKGRWKYCLKIAALTGAFVCALTVPLWIVDSNWMGDFIGNIRSNPNWSQPALLTQLVIRFDRQGFILWFITAITLLVISTVLWIKLAPHQAVLWSLALTTVAAPYLWSWDFTLLIPLFVYTAARLTKLSTRLVLSSIWIAIFLLSIWSRQFNQGDDRLWWLPFVMLAGIVLSLIMEYGGNLKYRPADTGSSGARL
jgi:hypothetical protein